MHKVDFPPLDIDDKEEIARVIFSPFMVEDGDVSPSAFNLRNLTPPEEYVSVFRHNYFVPTVENIQRITPPKDNIIYGYARLIVGICRHISYKDILINVLSHSSHRSPYHAGIHFSKSGIDVKGKCEDPDFLIVRRMLANNSELIAF